MLAALGLRYGSGEAIDFSVDIHKQLAVAAYGSSVELAKERGAFKIFDVEREKIILLFSFKRGFPRDVRGNGEIWSS